MTNPAPRTVAIVVLALLAGSLILVAAVLLAQGDGNAPIQVLAPSSEVVAGESLPGSGTPSSGQAGDELRVGETPEPDSVPVAGPASAYGLIDLNTASVELLDTLPGIGPVRAKAIADYREQSGPFQSVEEIINVVGIGTATYEKIRHLVTVTGTP